MSIAEGHGSIGEGPQIKTAEEALERVIGQLESQIVNAEKEVSPEAPSTTEENLVPILPGFPERVGGEILFLDADNTNSGACHPCYYLRGRKAGAPQREH